MDTFIQRLIKEHDELVNNTESLELFFLTELFDSISEEKKDLLLVQYDLMSAFISILDQRLELEFAEEIEEEVTLVEASKQYVLSGTKVEITAALKALSN